MSAIFLRFIGERRTSIIIMLLGLILTAWLLGSIVPSLSHDPAAINQIKQISKAMLVFSTGTTVINLLRPEGYLTSKYFGLWWLLMVGGYCLAMGSSIAGREIERGTAEATLTLPVSRNRYVIARLGAALLINIVHVVVGIGILWPISKAYNYDLVGHGLIYLMFYSFALSWVMLGLAMLLSLLIRERGRAISLAAGIFAAWHMINGLAMWKKDLEWLGWLSPLKFYHAFDAMTGHMSWDLAIIYGIAILLLGLAWLIFRRKDIAA